MTNNNLAAAPAPYSVFKFLFSSIEHYINISGLMFGTDDGLDV